MQEAETARLYENPRKLGGLSQLPALTYMKRSAGEADDSFRISPTAFDERATAASAVGRIGDLVSLCPTNARLMAPAVCEAACRAAQLFVGDFSQLQVRFSGIRARGIKNPFANAQPIKRPGPHDDRRVNGNQDKGRPDRKASRTPERLCLPHLPMALGARRSVKLRRARGERSAWSARSAAAHEATLRSPRDNLRVNTGRR